MNAKKQQQYWKKLFVCGYLVLILLILVVVASYTWFSISQTPRVSDMNLYINANSALQLATDPAAGDWSLQLDMRDMIPVTTPLRPVTWVAEEKRFYAASYGLDGRLTDFDNWEPLTDERHANKDNLDGYYVKLTLYARSDTAVDVELSPAVEVDEGLDGSGTFLIGTPLWNSEEILHSNGGQGAETAVRIGLNITPVDNSGIPTGEDAVFYIYEPNCDAHIDGSSGYVNTPSITGNEHLVEQDRLILQSASSWTETYPVQRDVVVKDLGEFTTDATLFSLRAGEMVRIDIYIWLEGQDVDCTNQIEDAMILACLQFNGKAEGQSGMTDIE